MEFNEIHRETGNNLLATKPGDAENQFYFEVLSSKQAVIPGKNLFNSIKTGHSQKPCNLEDFSRQLETKLQLKWINTSPWLEDNLQTIVNLILFQNL